MRSVHQIKPSKNVIQKGKMKNSHYIEEDFF